MSDNFKNSEGNNEMADTPAGVPKPDPALSSGAVPEDGDGNPETLRKKDLQLPRQRRRYPVSRVQQALYLLIALIVVAWLVSLI
ncbi:hypothetical protein [Corynebacterium caspium]|uniref:hypothetical protein n=1 Tax=Corynebacterium caspium TaxID=234828 RepID=UPI000376E0DC|nr:hypothetical protein [Corynebacterium caspium]WKD58887.1 hypothetical protein CCASP_02395 [Corynebacterium caspium DSM 44850]